MSEFELHYDDDVLYRSWVQHALKHCDYSDFLDHLNSGLKVIDQYCVPDVMGWDDTVTVYQVVDQHLYLLIKLKYGL